MQAPELYKTAKSILPEYYYEGILEFVKSLPWTNGERILDFGCGIGDSTKKFLAPVAKTYGSTINGLDLSEAMISYAKEFNSDPLIEYSSGNILEISSQVFPNSTFDKIISTLVFHFIKDYRSTLQKLYDILKPGGKFAFTLVLEPYIMNTFRILGNSEKWKQYMKGYEKFVPDWIELSDDEVKNCFHTCLTQIGFEIQSLENRENETSVLLEDWIQILLSVNPFLKNFPNDQHVELKADYVDILKSYGHDTSLGTEPIHVAHTVLFAVVTKPI